MTWLARGAMPAADISLPICKLINHEVALWAIKKE